MPTLPDIHTLVPHAAPMMLLDRLISVDEKSLSAELTITRESMFYDEKMQGVGAWIGIEYMAQAIAAFAGYQAVLQDESVKAGFLLGSRRYESACACFPLGCVLRVNVQCQLQNEEGLGAFECHIGYAHDSDAPKLATATVTVFQPDNMKHFLHNSMKANNE